MLAEVKEYVYDGHARVIMRYSTIDGGDQANVRVGDNIKLELIMEER